MKIELPKDENSRHGFIGSVDDVTSLTPPSPGLSLLCSQIGFESYSPKGPENVNIINKNINMSSFKSSENIQKKEGGQDRSVSDNQSSSVTLNELAMKARKIL